MEKHDLPDRDTLQTTLQQAWDTHSEFQEDYLQGVRDEMWAGWYAGFVIGRLGHFTTSSRLTRLLESVQAEHDIWTSRAADFVLEQLAGED